MAGALRRWTDLFFFQAEDGIRDGHVTGVQTCALPICGLRPQTTDGQISVHGMADSAPRSEERRVGKECRCRGAPDREKEEAGGTEGAQARDGQGQGARGTE